MKYQLFVSGSATSRSRCERDVGGDIPPAERRNTGDSRESADDGMRASVGGDGAAYSSDGRMPSLGISSHSPEPDRAGTPGIRCFPPVIQFLTDVDPDVQRRLQAICTDMQFYEKGLQNVCRELYLCARSEGYELSLAVQQVFSTQMPSFPNQTVQTALLLADAKPIASPKTYRYSRVAV
jgi:hypothetical protein